MYAPHLVLKGHKVFQVYSLGDDVEEAQVQHSQTFRSNLHMTKI